MLRPVGSQPPSVYWRRRLLLIGSVVIVLVLLVITVRALTSDSGGSSSAAGGAGSPSPTPLTSAPVSPSTSARSSAPSSSPRSSSTPRSSTASSSKASSAAPATCRLADLAVSAAVAAPNYKVGAMPMLEMQVTNAGKAPCVQDLADKQVVLKVYNGESRVWGSHDCEVQAGSTLRVLAVNSSVRVTISWSGLTSQPNNCSSRQRVGAGTYTLYATLGGKTGKAAQFTIT